MKKNLAVLFILLLLCGCKWERITESDAYYPLNTISAKKGQSVQSLFDDNGAPNAVDNLADGSVVWTYYTNYQPVGGGELISYNTLTNAQGGTTCATKVTLFNDTVKNVMSNCR